MDLTTIPFDMMEEIQAMQEKGESFEHAYFRYISDFGESDFCHNGNQTDAQFLATIDLNIGENDLPTTDRYINEHYQKKEVQRSMAIIRALETKLEKQYKENGKFNPSDIDYYILMCDTLKGRAIGGIKNKIQRFEHYEKTLVDSIEVIHSDQERHIKAQMKKRISKRLERMENPVFFTQTFNDDTLPEEPKQYIDYWRHIFDKLGIENWCLISDYGAKYGRLHFHGYLDIKKSLLDTLPRDDKNRITLPSLSSYGFNYIQIISNESDKVKTLGYCTKYMIKDLEVLGCKHELFGSRTKRPK